MNDNIGKDLTQGNMTKNLIALWLPMLIGTLLTMGYSIVDAIWIGNIVGDEAIGAVAIAFPVLLVLVALSSGATMATSILVSQYLGAKNNEMVEKVINNSFSIGLIITSVVTIGGIAISKKLLIAMGTPSNIFDISHAYLNITLISFIFMYMFALISSILRGMGETIKPMYFVLISTIINAVLDPILIIGIGPMPQLGLIGAAIASLFATIVSTILGILYLRKKYPIVSIKIEKLKIDKEILLPIIKIGLPSILQQLLLSISAGFITTFVNAFGIIATSAYGAVTKIDSLVAMPAMAMSMAISVVTGQCIGSNKSEKIKEIFKSGLMINSIVCLFITIVVVIFPRPVLSLFVHNEQVLEQGTLYLRVVGAAYVLVGITFVPNGIINGAGKTVVSLIISAISICIIRIPLAGVLSTTSLGLLGIWLAIVISYLISTINYLIYYRFGKLNNHDKIISENIGKTV